MSGIQGKGGRQEPLLALKSERKLPTGLKGLSSISAEDMDAQHPANFLPVWDKSLSPLGT